VATSHKDHGRCFRHPGATDRRELESGTKTVSENFFETIFVEAIIGSTFRPVGCLLHDSSSGLPSPQA
jgi:hypothetical protein